MKNLLLLTLLLVASVAALAEAPAERRIAYSKINQFLQFIQDAKSPFVIADTRIAIEGPDASYAGLEVHLYRDGKKDQQIAIGEDGRVKLPLLTTAEAASSELVINRDPKHADLDVNIGFVTPDKTEYRYGELFGLLDDANHYIELMGGALSWIIPKMNALVFKFDRPAHILVQINGVNKRYDTDGENTITLQRSKKLLKSDAVISFSQLPIAMQPSGPPPYWRPLSAKADHHMTGNKIAAQAGAMATGRR